MEQYVIEAKLQAFLNVIEDARIEKKIKRKYPALEGLIKRFAEIMNMNLFSIESFDRFVSLLIVSMYSQKSSYHRY